MYSPPLPVDREKIRDGVTSLDFFTTYSLSLSPLNSPISGFPVQGLGVRGYWAFQIQSRLATGPLILVIGLMDPIQVTHYKDDEGIQ